MLFLLTFFFFLFLRSVFDVIMMMMMTTTTTMMMMMMMMMTTTMTTTATTTMMMTTTAAMMMMMKIMKMITRLSIFASWQLFNVAEDPAERHNLIDDPAYASIVRRLKKFMKNESKKLVPFPKELVKEKTGDPMYYSGAWSPGWCCL